MGQIRAAMSKNIDYEKDFSAWAVHNAKLLRQGRLSEIDVEHIAEELEGMGKNNRRELISRLKILLGHLLKWQYQSGKRSRSWRITIDGQRIQINDLLNDNPILKPHLPAAVVDAYPAAVRLAVKDTYLPSSHFLTECPYTLEKILDEDCYPGD